MDSFERDLIPQDEMDQTVRAYHSDFVHIKSEMHLLEKNDFG
jgi:hypothetical protein